MIGKTPTEHQMSIFDVAFESFIDMHHELVLLSRQIDWEEVESEFSENHCADNVRPSVPIRTMVGMMLLKSIYNLSDEGVVARWLENPHMQYFTGEKVFQKRPPMNPIDMTKFRKRIGSQGAEKIFKISLMVNAKEITAKEILTDRGYRGKKSVGSTEVSIPTSGSPGQSYYEKRTVKKKFCKRAGIEPVIGHLKSDHRMMRNYLKGTLGDAVNTLMADAAYNMRHWMNKNALSPFVSWLLALVGRLENVIFGSENQCAC